MRISRLIALAAISVLVLGVVGASSYRAFPQSARGPVAQAQDCANQDDDTAQIQGGDTDNVEPQYGDQNDADIEEAASATGTDDVEEQVGDQDGLDNGAEVSEEQETAPTGTPAITAQAAQDTAEGYLNAGTATQVELDDEDGTLIYSVEIGGTDVKVDAMTGVVLGAETGQD